MLLLVMHLFLAYLWYMLSPFSQFSSFFSGLVIGYIFLLLFHRVFGSPSYIRQSIGLGLFIIGMLKLIIIGIWNIVRALIFPRSLLSPLTTIDIDISDFSETELFIFSFFSLICFGSFHLDHQRQVIIFPVIYEHDLGLYQDVIHTHLIQPMKRFTE